MNKPIMYIDMDGVVADVAKGISRLAPGIDTNDYSPENMRRVDRLVEKNSNLFEHLPLIPGAVDAVNKLFTPYEVYFLSTPMWNVPESFSGKRVWLEKYFGDKAKKRLILTHRKDLSIGDYLVDDRLLHGVDRFKGEHIQFGSPRFPSWNEVLNYLEV